jgi:uncharacterized protein (DUF362 family)
MSNPSKVFLIKTKDREYGINSLMDQINLNKFSGKKIALKSNFNSADPFPATTHIKTLEIIIEKLKKANIANLTLAERSGMGNTKEVIGKMGVLDLSKKLDFTAIALDEEDKNEWIKVDKEGTHWNDGFYISKRFIEADTVIQTCCLKPHRFGGDFTLSLKNSVGLIAKIFPGDSHDYMYELHKSPNQRLMIAEINKYYNVDFIIMDAIKAFISQGPDKGDIVEPNLILLSEDRVAIDAVGVAILRHYGIKTKVSEGRIFELDQIKRASELKIGITSADEIELIPLNPESHADVNNIQKILEKEG